MQLVAAVTEHLMGHRTTWGLHIMMKDDARPESQKANRRKQKQSQPQQPHPICKADAEGQNRARRLVHQMSAEAAKIVEEARVNLENHDDGGRS